MGGEQFSMGQKTRLLSSYWPRDTSQHMISTTLGELLRGAAQKSPDRIALVEGIPDKEARRRWTYRDLLDQADRIARSLLARFQPGERVAICSPNCPEWVLLQLGASLAGIILVPMNPAFRKAEIDHILKTAGAAGLFFTDRYRDVDLAAIVRDLAPGLPDLRVTVSLSDWDDFVSSAPSDVPLPEIGPDDILQIQFTSGTTGFPKGACLTHRGVITSATYSARVGGLPDGGVWINAMPMFHIGGVATEIGTFAQNGTYVLMPGFDAGLMLELFESERGVTTLVVPTMLHGLLEHPDINRRDTSSIQVIACGASAVPPPLIRRAKQTFGCDFTIPFGQTELSGMFCQALPSDSTEDQCETVGRPLPHVEVKIADPLTGDVRATGEIGEIWVRGYQTMTGFFGMPEETRKTITDDGWLKTGDLATMDDRGYLRITGRLKDMIIRGGMNLYPAEIEYVLVNHPNVAQVSVVGVADEKWGEVVAAVIVPASSNVSPDPDMLDAYCRESLAAHKTPSLWYFVESFPTNATGKVQKFAIQDWIRSGSITPTKTTFQKQREASG